MRRGASLSLGIGLAVTAAVVGLRAAQQTQPPAPTGPRAAEFGPPKPETPVLAEEPAEDVDDGDEAEDLNDVSEPEAAPTPADPTAPVTVEVAGIMAALREDPNDQKALDRLASLHAQHQMEDEIMTFVLQLARENPGSHVVSEALGELYGQEGDHAQAAEYYRKAAPYTTRPMRVYAMLAISEIKAEDYAGAAETALVQQHLVADYVRGRRDANLIADKIQDRDVVIPCIFGAVAYAKMDDFPRAKAALADCGAGIVPEEQRRELVKSLPGEEQLEQLRDRDIDEIMD